METPLATGTSRHHWPNDPVVLYVHALQELRARLLAAETPEEIQRAIEGGLGVTRNALTILRLDPDARDGEEGA